VKPTISRRKFVQNMSFYGAGAWASLQLPRPAAARAAAASSKPASLSPAEWKTLEAITGRIIPSDEQPGAIDAYCVNFIDKALANEDAEMKPLYQLGLAGTDAVAQAAHGLVFADLGAEQQDALLGTLERGEAAGWPEAGEASQRFFEAVRVHTITGFLADPKYGGNRDEVGWQVSGYPGPRHRMGGYTPAQVEGREPIPRKS
jgi:gluconate 2-dehydrogenase gamma chain